MKIYLAGGMRSEWRDDLKETSRVYEDMIFFDPTDTDLGYPQDYTFWDLTAIEECDVVFGFMEKDNPSGLGLSCEIGYAKGLGKKIILVNEQTDNKYMRFIEECSDVYTEHLYRGVELLENMYMLYKE